MFASPKRWTPKEDGVLLKQVAQASQQQTARDWTSIAAHLPGRSNKDCRKRWANHLVQGLRKGPWDVDEDERLVCGVEEHGQQWPVVAEEVGTRSADQCSKRWQQVLDPSLDRSKWTEEEKQILLDAVKRHGRAWKTIQTRHFPGRSTNNVKNRYVTLKRRLHKQGEDSSEDKEEVEEASEPEENARRNSASNTDELPNTTADFPSNFDMAFDASNEEFNMTLSETSTLAPMTGWSTPMDVSSNIGGHSLCADMQMMDSAPFEIFPEPNGINANGHGSAMFPEPPSRQSISTDGRHDSIVSSTAMHTEFTSSGSDLSAEFLADSLNNLECILKIQNPSVETLTSIVGTLAQTQARYTMDMK